MRRSRLLFAFPFGKGVVLRKAAFSYRKPSPLGKGDRAAVDRVLSLIVDLRRISSPSFIPLVPYPARSARHLPHAGKALSVGILFPHIRVFILTMREKRHPHFAAHRWNSIPIRTIKPPCGATCIAPQGGLYISTGAISRHPVEVKGDPC